MKPNRGERVLALAYELWKLMSRETDVWAEAIFDCEEQLAVYLSECLHFQEFGPNVITAGWKKVAQDAGSNYQIPDEIYCDPRLQSALDSEASNDFYNITVVDIDGIKRMFNGDIPFLAILPLDDEIMTSLWGLYSGAEMHDCLLAALTEFNKKNSCLRIEFAVFHGEMDDQGCLILAFNDQARWFYKI
ncbi:TPA: hypothetical protein DF272_05425 [Candidatus Falkowbacteria bacterium]|nr:hypothetical protein [Candidatus Falkowbacteria bacterium]